MDWSGKLGKTPLPKPGVAFKHAWGDDYDFYGRQLTRVDASRPSHRYYNKSLDNLWTLWHGHMDRKFFFKLRAQYDKKFGRQQDFRSPFIRASTIVPLKDIFVYFYGSTDINGLLKMIRSDSRALNDAWNKAYMNHFEQFYGPLYAEFEQLCKKSGMEMKDFPEREWDFHESFMDTVERKRIDDHIDGLFGGDDYTIGMETPDGMIHEVTASFLVKEWIVGRAIQGLAGAICGLEPAINDLNNGVERTWFGRFIRKMQSSAIQRDATSRTGFCIRIERGGKKYKFDANDIVRFYPPRGDAVPNPIGVRR